jgi:hypothetical protein
MQSLAAGFLQLMQELCIQELPSAAVQQIHICTVQHPTGQTAEAVAQAPSVPIKKPHPPLTSPSFHPSHFTIATT